MGARCAHCLCVKNDVSCVSCQPSKQGKCQNLPTERRRIGVESANASQSNSLNIACGNFRESHTLQASHSNLCNPPAFSDAPSVSSLINMGLIRSSTKVLKRIPKASRMTAAIKLAAILDGVSSNNDVDSWIHLFKFPSHCLHESSTKRWSSSKFDTPDESTTER